MNIIYELSPSRFSLVAPLFSKVLADKALTDSVLEGTRPARVFVDYLDGPTAALIASFTGDYYVMGEPRPGRLRQFLHDVPVEVELFEEGGITLHAPQRRWKDALEADSDGALHFHPVRTFRYNRYDDPLPAQWGRTHADVTLNRIDRDVLHAATEGYLTLPQGFDAARLECIYRDGFGYVALLGDEMVAISYAKAVSSWYASLHTETAPGHRQQGIGSLVTAAFMAECLTNRQTPLVSCRVANDAAATLALQLGFDEGPQHYICTEPLPPTEGNWRAEEHPPDVVPDSVLWMRTSDMVFASEGRSA